LDKPRVKVMIKTEKQWKIFLLLRVAEVIYRLVLVAPNQPQFGRKTAKIIHPSTGDLCSFFIGYAMQK